MLAQSFRGRRNQSGRVLPGRQSSSRLAGNVTGTAARTNGSAHTGAAAAHWLCGHIYRTGAATPCFGTAGLSSNTGCNAAGRAANRGDILHTLQRLSAHPRKGACRWLPDHCCRQPCGRGRAVRATGRAWHHPAKGHIAQPAHRTQLCYSFAACAGQAAGAAFYRAAGGGRARQRQDHPAAYHCPDAGRAAASGGSDRRAGRTFPAGAVSATAGAHWRGG